MKPEHFTFAFLVSIYQVFSLEQIYNQNNINNISKDRSDSQFITIIGENGNNSVDFTNFGNRSETGITTDTSDTFESRTTNDATTTFQKGTTNMPDTFKNGTSNDEMTTFGTVNATDGFENGTINATDTLEYNTTGTQNSTINDTTTTSVITSKPTKGLPTLPEAFQTRIRLSIYNPSSTYDVFVSYDLMNNMAAVTWDDGLNKNRQIYDFTRSSILKVVGNQCVSEGILQKSSGDIRFPFPFRIKDGIKQMEGPLVFFRLDGNDTEIEEEEVYVSGVPCTQYNKIIDLGYIHDCRTNVQCNIRQFYSNPEWRNPYCLYCDPMPIRIDVHCGNTHLSCYHRQLTFSFLEFHKIKDREEFQQPPGVYCENTTSEPFPKLSSSFVAALTEKDFLNKTLTHKKIWWSETAGILRIDVIVGNKKTMSVIKDFNRNLVFNITKLDTACEITSKNEDKPSIFSFLVDSDVKKIQKVGKKKCDLSECEVWTGETTLEKIFDIYLNKISSRGEDFYIPIFVDFFHKKTLRRYARRKFDTYRPALGDWNAFDVSPCFVEETGTRFELSIKGNIGDEWKNPSFRENIYHSIWNYSKIISPLRLQKLQIVPETNETIKLKGIIIDDMSKIREFVLWCSDICAKDAIKNIQGMSNRENIFENNEGYRMKITAFKIEDDKTDRSTGGKKYGPGDMAGLAIGMLLGGAICGAAAFLLIIRIRKKRKQG